MNIWLKHLILILVIINIMNIWLKHLIQILVISNYKYNEYFIKTFNSNIINLYKTNPGYII